MKFQPCEKCKINISENCICYLKFLLDELYIKLDDIESAVNDTFCDIHKINKYIEDKNTIK